MEERERSKSPTLSGRGPPSVTVIIPHYLGDVVSRCLRSVFATMQRVAFEVIVVDDQPLDDGSIARAVTEFPSVTVVKNRGPHGFGAACNAGVGVARGKYIAILNNDVVVSAGWLDALVAAGDAAPDVAAFQSKIRSLQHPERFDYSGAAGGMIDWLGFPFALGRVFDAIEVDRGQYDESRDIFWAVGCGMFIRRAALDIVGGFDEAFYMHMEEIDLCWRIHLAGFRVRSCPGSIVYHENGHTLKQGSFRKAYLNHRNNLVLLTKNLPWQRALWVLAARVLLVAGVVVHGLVRRDWRQPLAAIAGVMWWLTHLPSVLRRRAKARAVRRVADAEMLGKMRRSSVIFRHFVQREAAPEAVRRTAITRRRSFADARFRTG